MEPRHLSKSEREAFLADVHIAVLSISNGEGAPVVSPVWYAYTPGGDIHLTIERDGQKGKALHEGKIVSLCVQNEQPPVGYVVVEGPSSISEQDYERDTVDIAKRYLGDDGADAYLSMVPKDVAVANNVLVRITPQVWKTVLFE